MDATHPVLVKACACTCVPSPDLMDWSAARLRVEVARLRAVVAVLRWETAR